MNKKMRVLYFGLFAIIIITNSFAQNKKPLNYKHVKGAEQVIVYSQENRFAAWPANNGAWLIDRDEILVGFTEVPIN